MKKSIFILFSLFISSLAFAQNIVWFTDGTVLDCKSAVIDTSFVKVIKQNDKVKYYDTAVVFAIITGADSTFLYNNPDYPLDNAKMFIKGQIDGKNYKNNLVYAGAFVSGASFPVLLTVSGFSAFWSPLLSGIYVAGFSKVNTNSKHCDIPEEYKNNEDYIKGYKLSASKKKITNNTIFSVIGIASGITIISLIVE